MDIIPHIINIPPLLISIQALRMAPEVFFSGTESFDVAINAFEQDNKDTVNSFYFQSSLVLSQAKLRTAEMSFKQ